MPKKDEPKPVKHSFSDFGKLEKNQKTYKDCFKKGISNATNLELNFRDIWKLNKIKRKKNETETDDEECNF